MRGIVITDELTRSASSDGFPRAVAQASLTDAIAACRRAAEVTPAATLSQGDAGALNRVAVHVEATVGVHGARVPGVRVNTLSARADRGAAAVAVHGAAHGVITTEAAGAALTRFAVLMHGAGSHRLQAATRATDLPKAAVPVVRAFGAARKNNDANAKSEDRR